MWVGVGVGVGVGVCVCVWTSVNYQEDTRFLQLLHQLIDRAKLVSMFLCVLAGTCGAHVLPHATKLWT